MSKTITIISAMVFVLCLLSSPLMGQSSADAIRRVEPDISSEYAWLTSESVRL